MFHGRSLLKYDLESEQAILESEQMIGRLYQSINKKTLIKLFFLFCSKCKSFDSAKNIVTNLKTIFTNSYCRLANRIGTWEIPPEDLEMIGIAFRIFYMDIKYPTKEIARFQVCGLFKLIGLQILLQVLNFHFSKKQIYVTKLMKKVKKNNLKVL